jgi:putative endonuclease
MATVYRVYVLQNREGRFYIGLTDDLLRRIHQHNSGASRWTKRKGPWILRWQSEELSLSDARRLENALKRQKRGTGFFRMTGLPRS